MAEPVEEVAAATGGAQGVVVDLEGVPIPGARASLSSRNLHAPLEALVDDQGRYHFRDLVAGTYALSVQADRFEPVRRTVEVTGGRTTHLNLSLRPVYGPWWEGRGLFRDTEAQRGTFVLEEELRILPVHGLGGVEGVARHPALGATWLASDVLWTDGRPYTPVAPEPAVAGIDPRGLTLYSERAGGFGYGQIDTLADGTGWRGVALLPGPILANREAFFVGAFDAEPPHAGAFVRVDYTPVSALDLAVRGVSGDNVADAGTRAVWRPGGDVVLTTSAGVLADLTGTSDSTRGYVGVEVERQRAWFSHHPRLRADLLSGTGALPAHARVTIEDPWAVTGHARVLPSVSWRRRGDDDAVEWGISTATDPVGTERGALFGAVTRRWEGIDTDTLPLVRRDELLLGGGLSLDRAWRIKMSVEGAVRHDASGDLPADANAQLAIHRPLDSDWGLVAAVTWRPELRDLDVDLAPYEAGGLVCWMQEGRMISPIVGVGAGGQAGNGAPRGQIAARLGVSVRALGQNADVAVEGAMGDPGWTTTTTRDVRDGPGSVSLSFRIR